MPQGPLAALVGKIFGNTTYSPMTMGKQSQLSIAQRNGKYYLGSYISGNQSLGAGHMSCSIATQSAATLIGIGGSTSYTGLAVGNPTGSGYNLALSKVIAVSGVIGAAIQSWGIVKGFNTFTPGENSGAGLPILNNFLGAAITNSVALASAAATVVTADQSLLFPLVANQIAAGNITGAQYDDDGEHIIAPGQWVGFVSLEGTPTTSNFWGYLSWQQIPI